ncbi:MAG: putative O-glycosylation ligase, exosortase A system-associated [Nevskia sp.]|nr:putative O-glycosylation ligase, exosortase A system-associated [Nevskia sp.]
MRDLAFMALFLFMLINAARCLHTSTMLWAWIALCAPQQYMYGIAGALPLNKIAVIATVISVFIDQTKRKPYIDWHILLVGLFVLQGVISYSVGLSGSDRTYYLLDKMLKIYLLCCVMTMANRGRLQIHSMVIIICLGMGIHGALEGLKYIDSGGGHVVVAPPSIGDNNYLAMATLMVMPLLVYMFRYSESRLIRLSFAGALLACFAGVVATASRGGLVGMGVFGVFLFLHSRRKMATLLVIVVLAAGLAYYAPGRWLERMDTIGVADEDGSFMNRVSSWKLNTIMALDRPLVGGGYSALEDWTISDIYRQKFHRLDSLVTSPEPTAPLAAHSIYFETLGDLGFPGLFLFLAVLFTGFRNVHHILRYTRQDESLIWARDLAVLFRLSLIVFMVCGALLSAAYFELIYIMLTQISVLRHHLEETVVVAKPLPGYVLAAPDAVGGIPVGSELGRYR